MNRRAACRLFDCDQALEQLIFCALDPRTPTKVRGILLIAPGTASVLNEQFDTYVFSDGMRFARFVYPR